MHINKAMLTDVLKGELGFGGFVISDFNACFQVGASSNQDGLGKCLNAGVDMFMTYNQTIPTMLGYFAALVKAGTVAQDRVDDAVRRIIAVKCELGLFEATGNGRSCAHCRRWAPPSTGRWPDKRCRNRWWC
jgi:beta-glucosidase